MSGPLVARWLAVEGVPGQAGTLAHASVEVENAGSAPWRTRGPEEGHFLSYHWLDGRGNPIVWDGIRTPLEDAVAPGTTLRQRMAIRAPIPPGSYRLAVDIVEEHRFWLAELGVEPFERGAEVGRRDASGARHYLGEDTEPAPDWAERARTLHEEGYAAVGGAIEARRAPAGLEEYAPEAGSGRRPGFRHPLVCPSLLPPLEPNDEVAGLPAYRPDEDEPWMFDGRLRITLRSRSGRRRA